jgi:hypothetical protein
MSNTKTLSVRVPIDVAVNIENLCKQRGITRNALLQECIASEGVVNVNSFEKGGVTPIMNKELSTILVGVGSLATGVTIYHILMEHLPKTWSQEKREFVAGICAVGGGVGMAYGLDKVTRKK